VVVLALGGCSSAAEPARTTPAAAGATAPSALPPTGEVAIEGSFDVGDHELYLECRGDGSPTIVYLHGYIGEPSSGGRNNWATIPDLLEDRYRVCTYDRANVGDSGRGPGLQTGSDSVRDLRELLEAAEVPGPYVLLGGVVRRPPHLPLRA
jgi:pimeloyl-ACP methyl ester carboxylesterase